MTATVKVPPSSLKGYDEDAAADQYPATGKVWVYVDSGWVSSQFS